MFYATELLLGCSVIIAVLYWYLTKNFNYWKLRNVPYKNPLPFFGNLLQVVLGRMSTGHYLAQLYNEFEGPYFGFFTLDKPFLVVKDPEIIKRIVIKDFQSFPNRFFYTDEKLDSIIPNVLFGLKAPMWKTLRMKLSPIFTTGKIKMMLPLMVECSENMTKYLETRTKSSVETKELTAKYTTDVIATCAFGINANSFANENSEFRVAGRKLFKDSFTRSIQPLAYVFAHKLVKLFRMEFIDGEALQFLRGAFNKTIKQRETSKAKRNDLIDILIELKNEESNDDEFKFSGDRLVAQAVIFFAAGHETTSSTIALTLYELAINQDIQNKLRKEITDVTDQFGELTYETVSGMKYLQMVISETLRKYPISTFLQRMCEEDYLIEETGLVIERGVVVLIPLIGLQCDPNYFPEPQKYDPERFNEQNKVNMNHYAYLPFGEGPRNCIGRRFGLLNSKLGVLYIIKNFLVTPSPETKIPLVFGRAFLLQSVGGVPLTYTRIKH